MDQATLDRAVEIATTRAMAGHPVSRIVWIPPVTATIDPRGTFAIEDAPAPTGSNPEPWRR
jgi:hypothetical protein